MQITGHILDVNLTKTKGPADGQAALLEHLVPAAPSRTGICR